MTPTAKEIDSLTICLRICQGRGFIAKDRNLLGERTTSDPYVQVQSNGKIIGKTKIIPTTLAPVWDETIQYTLSHSETKRIVQQQGATTPIELNIFDYDEFSDDDNMGTVVIHLDPLQEHDTKWYPVGKGSGDTFCHNAQGELEIGVTATARKVLSLVRGNVHPIRYDRIEVGLAWDMEENSSTDLDASCVAIDNMGNILMNDTVYYGNLNNSNFSITHSGDEQEGDEVVDDVGDDEVIRCDLNLLPPNILALYFILTVATPNKTFEQVRSARVQVRDSVSRTPICNFFPHELGTDTAMFLARLARKNENDWVLTPIGDGDSIARDFGSLIPQIKSYTRDLLPDIVVDPKERVAILRKGGTIRVRDFVPVSPQVPEWVTFGLAWDATPGIDIDLDASVVCLDENLECTEIVFYKHLESSDGAIVHGGDKRDGEDAGDDEKIRLSLSAVSPNVHYLGFSVTSYSGQELDDVVRASCHLFHSKTGQDIAKYSLSHAKELDKHTALVLGCLYRSNDDGDWNFRIISEAAEARVAREIVGQLQDFLRNHPPQPLYVPPPEPEIVISAMPDEIPHDDEEEIVVMPAPDLATKPEQP